MTFIATLPEGDRFIEVRYIGSINCSQIYAALAARSGLAHQHAIEDHLIDCSQVETLPDISDLYLIAARIREILDRPIRKAALVAPQSISLATTLLFFILKACQYGVFMVLFENRQDAVRWLASPES
jgi:hypothetical protein